jgi:hypothetical protein
MSRTMTSMIFSASRSRGVHARAGFGDFVPGLAQALGQGVAKRLFVVNEQ